MNEVQALLEVAKAINGVAVELSDIKEEVKATKVDLKMIRMILEKEYGSVMVISSDEDDG